MRTEYNRVEEILKLICLINNAYYKKEQKIIDTNPDSWLYTKEYNFVKTETHEDEYKVKISEEYIKNTILRTFYAYCSYC